MFTTKQLTYLHSLLGGPQESEFTAQDVIVLRGLVKKELSLRETRAPLPTPPITAEQQEIARYIEQKGVNKCADPHITEAARKRAKFINERAERAAAERDREAFEALDTSAALSMLGL